MVKACARQLNAVVSKQPGRALCLWGEAGIGKSHAAEQILAEVPCVSVRIHATAPDVGLLRALPQSISLPAWAASQLERALRGAALEQMAFSNMVIAVLKAAAPVIVWLEDAHEADSDRRGLIERLARAAPRLRGVGLLVTSRQAPSDAFQEQVLEPLTPEESNALVEGELRTIVPSPGLDYVFGRAQGNPLYTLEFVRYLVRQGCFWSDGQQWHWRKPPTDFMPITVETLIQQLIQHATASDQADCVLEARAYLPVVLDNLEAIWLEVSGVTNAEFELARAALEASGLLRGVQFCHPLMRELVARRMPEKHRTNYARRALRLLENDPWRAVDFLHEAQLSNANNTRVLKKALEQVRGNREATARLLAQRVTLTPEANRVKAALKAARALLEIDLVTAAQLTEFAFSRESRSEEALELMCEVRLAQHRPDEAWAVLESFVVSRQGAKTHWQLSIRCAFERGDFLGAVILWRSQPRWQQQVQTSTLQSLIWSLIETAETNAEKQAHTLIANTLERASATHDHYVLLHLRGQLALRFNRLEHAEQDFLTAIELAERDHANIHQATFCNHLAELYFVLDDNQNAIRYLERARQLLEAYGSPFDLAQIEVRLGFAKLESARYEEAEMLLLQGRTALEGHPNPALIEVDLILALLYHSWETPHGEALAYRYAQSGLKTARTWGTPFHICTALCRVVQIEIAQGRLETANAYALEANRLARNSPLALQARSQWALARVLAAQGQTPTALEYFRTASKVFANLNDQSLIHQIGVEVDLLQNNLEPLTARLEWFRAHGLDRFAGLVERALTTQPTHINATPIKPRLNVLGLIHLSHDGQLIACRARKRLECLVYLLEARLLRRAEVETLELIDALYPGESEPEAKAALKQLVYLLRHQLGQHVILSTANGYKLCDLESDAEELLMGGSCNLWRGPYLAKFHTGFMPAVREALLQSLRQAIETHWREPREAARLACIWLEMEPFDADALTLTLQTLHRAEDHKGLAEIHRAAVQRFFEVGATLPPKSQQVLRTIQN